jgi:hypothetical protein
MVISGAVTAADAIAGRQVQRWPVLPEREGVRLGAGLAERELQGPFADRVMLAYELVEATFPEQSVAVDVDVDAV